MGRHKDLRESINIDDVDPVPVNETSDQTPQRPPGVKQKGDRWADRKSRHSIYLDNDVKKAAEKRIKRGGSPHPYLSSTINELLENWLAGYYDEANRRRGWPEPR